MKKYIYIDVRWERPQEAPSYLQIPINIYAQVDIAKHLQDRYGQKVLGWQVSTRKFEDLSPLEKLVRTINEHTTDDEVYMIWYMSVPTLVKKHPKIMGNVYAACYERIVDAMGRKAFLGLDDTKTPEQIEIFKLSNINWMIIKDYFAQAGVSI